MESLSRIRLQTPLFHHDQTRIHFRWYIEFPSGSLFPEQTGRGILKDLRKQLSCIGFCVRILGESPLVEDIGVE